MIDIETTLDAGAGRRLGDRDLDDLVNPLGTRAEGAFAVENSRLAFRPLRVLLGGTLRERSRLSLPGPDDAALELLAALAGGVSCTVFTSLHEKVIGRGRDSF